ncbi:MAG: trypsin-like peptidase domain-containing protein [Archangiaceae bacterium]|nr:trypsin-like peptidase domain-containing protein [Archangiaceae bacterium]
MNALLWVAALTLGDVNSRRDAVVQVVEKFSPAVVYVGTVQLVERSFRSMSPLDDFFFGPRERTEAIEGLGSGVIVDPAGIILTNEHVIRGASQIHVILADGRKLDADVVGSDNDNDLAVLKIVAKGPLPAAKIGNSNDLMIGEKVIAIGSPFGLKKTVTVGVVSAVGRSFKADNRDYDDFIQTDASINPGNSGGPLLNIDGEVIGINSAIYAGGQGIGFAIPADKVKRVVAELSQFGKLRPAWVGFEVENLNPKVARATAWDRTYGALVVSVEPGSPAEAAGVQDGDIVVSAGGHQVDDANELRARLKSYPAKAGFPLEVFRDGKTVPLTVTPAEFPPRLADELGWKRLGFRVKAAGGAITVAAIRPGSNAAKIGFQPGDVISKVNGRAIASENDWREALVSSRGASSVLILVRRGRAGYHITLPF